MISDTKFINRVLIDTSVEQRFKLIKKGFFINVLLIVSSQPGSLNSIHMFKKWLNYVWVNLCHTCEMRNKEKKNALRSFLLLPFLFLNPD